MDIRQIALLLLSLTGEIYLIYVKILYYKTYKIIVDNEQKVLKTIFNIIIGRFIIIFLCF